MLIEFGLYEVADSASLTLVFFPALVLLSVLGLRFGYYALRNRSRTELGAQTPIWNHLLYVGLMAALYGAFGVLEIVSTVVAPYKAGFMLATVFLLAVAIRQIHLSAVQTAAPSTVEWLIRGLFVVLVFGYLVGAAVQAPPRFLAAVEGLAALAFLGYGLAFYRAQTTQSRLQGTMIDSLLRHLLPVLAFGALVNVTNVAFALGVDGNVVPHIQVVFILMTASTLMTATIKLRQNLASL